MVEEDSRGQDAVTPGKIHGGTGWVTTQQAARALGISPRTVRWHIKHGNLVAESSEKGVQRTWSVSIDSLQSFRDSRQHAGELPQDNRTDEKSAAITPDITGNPIRELADRLAEEAAKAAEYRVRLELTEQAQSTLAAQLVEERRRREEAERELDELRRRLEATPEPPQSPTPSPEASEGTSTTPDAEGPHEPAQRRSWWRRWFGG